VLGGRQLLPDPRRYRKQEWRSLARGGGGGGGGSPTAASAVLAIQPYTAKALTGIDSARCGKYYIATRSSIIAPQMIALKSRATFYFVNSVHNQTNIRDQLKAKK